MQLQVQSKGNDAIIEALTEAGALLKREQYPHKYPYDWRTKKPTIFRATDQVCPCDLSFALCLPHAAFQPSTCCLSAVAFCCLSLTPIRHMLP